MILNYKMGRTAENYSRTVIYKLYSTDPDIVEGYIGHSADFDKRKTNHKSDCSNPSELNTKYNHKVYEFIRENGGFDTWRFEILEEANLTTKKEAETLERYYIETLEPELNDALPAQTPEERKEYMRVYRKIWNRKNPGYKKNWDKNNPGYMKEYNKKLGEDPEYRKERAEYKKKYRAANPEKRAELLKKVVCECGAVVCNTGLPRHLTSNIHFKKLKNKSQEA